jgi:hypothetical protein
MNFKEVKYDEFRDFIDKLEEFHTTLYCEGNDNQSAGGIAYISKDKQVASATLVGKKQQYFILVENV